MSTRLVGEPIKRLEDPALLRGEGRFVDDIKLPDTLSASFVRSPFAHARIVGTDASDARTMPGVQAIYFAHDLPKQTHGKRLLLQVPNPAINDPLTPWPLAAEEVTFVGEAVAVVIADSHAQAEDAAGAVMIDYDPLDTSANLEQAIAPGAPVTHAHHSDNIAAKFSLGFGDYDAAVQDAAHVFEDTYFQHRGTGSPMEGRAVLAKFDAVTQDLTVWSSAQAPHGVKRALVDMLEMADTHVRVIAPDVGGGFGAKVQVYSEEIVIAACALLLDRPVKWIEDRREHFMCATQERDQLWQMQIAVNEQGHILGLKGHLIHDTGAHVTWGIIMPYIAATTVPGPYRIPAFAFDTTVVYTNKVATTPMRGAGRPQAVFAMERLLDLIASKLDIGRAEVRRRNLIPADAMPYKVGLIYRDGAELTYDSGDYPQCQKLALDTAGWESFEERRAAARADGRYVGIGLANYVEGTGLGPFEGATTRILPSGRVLLRTGAAAQGQGHVTVLAQVAADELSVPIDQVDVETGDTASVAIGVGTFASRIMVNAGSSVKVSSGTVAKKLKALAAAHFDVSEDDVELDNGAVRVTGEQGASIPFAELARMTSGMPGFSLPKGIEPGLEATHYFSPAQSTYSNGSHVAEVEVDPETCHVKVTRYIVAHDCGNVVNPLLVDGQIQGGVAHGIGNALMEVMRYDDDANPITVTFADYLLPDAASVPDVEIVHMHSPTPLNPLGVKGAGEGGTIPAAAAIISAIEDALRPFHVQIRETPVPPQRLFEILEDAG